MIDRHIPQIRMGDPVIFAWKEMNIPALAIDLRYPPGCMYTIGHRYEEDAQISPSIIG